MKILDYRILKKTKTDANGDKSISFVVEYLKKGWLFGSEWCGIYGPDRGDGEVRTVKHSTLTAAKVALRKHRADNNVCAISIEELNEDGSARVEGW